MDEFKRLTDEDENAYIWRVCENKDKIGSWQDVGDLLNEELKHEYTESHYRKMYQSFIKLFSVIKDKFLNDEYSKMLDKKIIELEKGKVKYRDERNEFGRLIKEQARRESTLEMVKRVLEDSDLQKFDYIPDAIQPSDNDLIIHLTDLHTGIEINNSFNKFDIEILRNRLSKYLDKINVIRKRHNSENCYLILGGDLISGIIHSSLRIENNENVIEQVMCASQYISEFTYELSKIFFKVEVHSVSGNHSRVTPNKDESLKGENLDELIPFYMKAKLQNIENVIICNNIIDESISSFMVRNKLYYALHGDKDGVNNVVQKLTMLTGIKPYGIILGHRHVNGMTTVANTKVVESGCMSGSDSYCMDKRLIGKPEQMVLVCDEDGIDCLYDIQLD